MTLRFLFSIVFIYFCSANLNAMESNPEGAKKFGEAQVDKYSQCLANAVLLKSTAFLVKKLQPNDSRFENVVEALFSGKSIDVNDREEAQVFEMLQAIHAYFLDQNFEALTQTLITAQAQFSRPQKFARSPTMCIAELQQMTDEGDQKGNDEKEELVKKSPSRKHSKERQSSPHKIPPIVITSDRDSKEEVNLIDSPSRRPSSRKGRSRSLNKKASGLISDLKIVEREDNSLSEKS